MLLAKEFLLIYSHLILSYIKKVKKDFLSLNCQKINIVFRSLEFSQAGVIQVIQLLPSRKIHVSNQSQYTNTLLINKIIPSVIKMPIIGFLVL